MNGHPAVASLEGALRTIDRRHACPPQDWPPVVVEVSPSDEADPDCRALIEWINTSGGDVGVSVAVLLRHGDGVEDYRTERDR